MPVLLPHAAPGCTVFIHSGRLYCMPVLIPACANMVSHLHGVPEKALQLQQGHVRNRNQRAEDARSSIPRLTPNSDTMHYSSDYRHQKQPGGKHSDAQGCCSDTLLAREDSPATARTVTLCVTDYNIWFFTQSHLQRYQWLSGRLEQGKTLVWACLIRPISPSFAGPRSCDELSGRRQSILQGACQP